MQEQSRSPPSGWSGSARRKMQPRIRIGIASARILWVCAALETSSGIRSPRYRWRSAMATNSSSRSRTRGCARWGPWSACESRRSFFTPLPTWRYWMGKLFALVPESLPSSPSLPGIVTVSLPPTRLGFASPSLFLANRAEHDGNGLKVFARPERRSQRAGLHDRGGNGRAHDRTMAGPAARRAARDHRSAGGGGCPV